MKSLLITLALMSSSVSAQEIFATAANTAGGEIVLLATQDDCKKGHRAMYSTLPNGGTLFGCWSVVSDFIKVRYRDGSVKMYEMSSDYWLLDPFYAKRVSKKGST